MHHAITQYLVWIMAKSYSTTVKTDIRGNASEGTLTSLKVLCTKLKETPEISIEIRNVKLKKFEIQYLNQSNDWSESLYNTCNTDKDC